MKTISILKTFLFYFCRGRQVHLFRVTVWGMTTPDRQALAEELQAWCLQAHIYRVTIAVKQVRHHFLSFEWQIFYNVFHQFWQAKFSNGGLILSSSQLSILPHQPLLATKVVKIYSKIIIWLPRSKLAKQTVFYYLLLGVEKVWKIYWSIKSLKDLFTHAELP